MLADNRINYWQLSACWAYEVYFFMVLRAMFIIFGLKSIIKQLLNLVYGFLHWKCIIKQFMHSVFVICKIINVSVRVIILAFGSANDSYIDIDNFHITINLIQPYVSHAMRPDLKDAVKCTVRIGSAHNKGGGSFRN